jgi:sigma-B regulation protein RsbQ
MTRDHIVKRNNVNILGKGEQSLVFAHGLGLDQTSWSLVQPAFQDEFKCIMFDHIGCGNSDISSYDEKKYSTLGGYADDLVTLCELLEVKNARFVGHSVSAMIGIIASLKRPALFDKMIFITPSPHYINDPALDDGSFPKKQLDNIVTAIDENYAKWVRTNMPVLLNNPDKPELERSLIDSFLKVDRKIAKQFAIATFFSDYRKELLKFQIRSLILQCKNDIMSPLQVGDYLHAHLGNNDLRVLDAEGHFPHLTDPAKVISAIKAFLARTEAEDQT